MIAYHFVGSTLRDGSPVPADGVKLTYQGTPILCQRGLHFSLDPFDALQYAPGPILCKVDYSGTVVMGGDKGVCTIREILARVDATDLLRYFARMEALRVAHLWSPNDATLDFLMTGDEALRAAAWAAAAAATRADQRAFFNQLVAEAFEAA